GLIDVLVEATARYLRFQVQSGAQVLQLFESWAEGLPEDLFQRLVIGPHRRIIEGLRALGVTAPVIGFPRGAGALVEDYALAAGVTAIGLDTQASAAVGKRIQARMPIQGAFDPMLLKAGSDRLEARVDELVAQWGDGPWVFNLGHGIDKDTPIAHVERLIARVKGQ
ncbi:MAG: uroporphyrinogen decarboxylase family protein, partial [Caulobacteraceae bacterium]